MVTRRNAIHSAVFLITTLLATAGIFLHARGIHFHRADHFVCRRDHGAVVFVIMLVRLDVALHQIQFSRQKWVALLVTLALALEVGVMLWSSRKVPGQGFLLAQRRAGRKIAAEYRSAGGPLVRCVPAAV